MRNIIFIAAGGRGKRLWKTLPRLEESKLPKSLGVLINDRPIIAYQLDLLTQIPDSEIVISFSNYESIYTFKSFVNSQIIKSFDYKFNVHKYFVDDTTIDIIRHSIPHTPWNNKFSHIIITSGDVYFDPAHLATMKTVMRGIYNVQTLCDFSHIWYLYQNIFIRFIIVITNYYTFRN
jgi:NDP-sugar pyrophosphorylase family protein